MPDVSDTQLKLEALRIAHSRLPASAPLSEVKREAKAIYDSLTLTESTVSRGTNAIVTDVTDTPNTVSDTERAHDQKAVDAMKTFYAPETGEATLSQSKQIDVGGKPATASKNLADMIPGLEPSTTYDFNKPTDNTKGYQ